MADKKNRRNYDALLGEFEQAMTACQAANAVLNAAVEAVEIAENTYHHARAATYQTDARRQAIEEKLRAYALIFGYELPDALTADTYKGEEDIPF